MKDLIKDVIRGSHRAVAKAISLVENDRGKARELIKGIYAHTGEARIIGITGAPGTGKSCLVDGMTGIYRGKKKKVGIIAVDPSSPFTGGAILGDRVRMMRHSADSGVFIRSMATRGHLGGLAAAAGETLAVLEAAGMDIVIIETVGVGQDEVEIVKPADVVCLVLTPASGDDIQIYKAGIMEIADVYVLNKADLPGSEKMEMLLRPVLEPASNTGKHHPLIKTSADRGEGVKNLVDAVDKMLACEKRQDAEVRRKRLLAWMFRDILRDHLSRRDYETIPDTEIEAEVEKIYHKKNDPYSAAEEMIKKMKSGTPKN